MEIPKDIRKYKKLLTTPEGKKVYNHYVSLFRLLNKDFSGNGLEISSSTVWDFERHVVKNFFLFCVRQILGDKYGGESFLYSTEVYLVDDGINIIFDDKVGDIIMESRFFKSDLGIYLDSFMRSVHRLEDYIAKELSNKSIVYVRVPSRDIAKLYIPLINLSVEYSRLAGLVEKEAIYEDTRHRAEDLFKEIEDTKADLCVFSLSESNHEENCIQRESTV